MTEPRPYATCAENSVKFGLVVSEIHSPTDRQTYRLTDTTRHNIPLPIMGRSNNTGWR